MNRIHPVLVFGLAILFGVMAVYMANQWLSTQAGPQKKIVKNESMPLTKIVIAAQDIGVGTPLTAKTLSLAEWPKANVPKGAFKEIDQVEGRVAVTRISAGEPLLNVELAGPNSGAGLVALIPKGQRAMSIRVDEVIGVAGFVLPNTFVDVIGVETKNRKKSARTILSKIKVLAIAQETYNEGGKAKVVRTVTLQVKPDESEKLALQTHKGSIHLVLRNPLDDEEPQLRVAKVDRKSVPVLRSKIYRPKPSPHAVEIIRASKRQEIKFKRSDSEERI